MRVRGNIKPEILIVAPHEQLRGKAEVRLAENINELTELDESTGVEITIFEYDEYVMVVDDEPGLKGKVEIDFNNWLLTGRTSEINTQATLYVNARNDAVDEYTQQLIEEGLL